MKLEVTTQDTAGLRYLDADHVEHPSGNCAGMSVCNEQNEELGSFNGVLIEPSTRRVRYFVVEPARQRRRFVLPADTTAVLDMDDRTLRVDADANDMRRLDSREVRGFSDDDLLEAMFRRAS